MLTRKYAKTVVFVLIGAVLLECSGSVEVLSHVFVGSGFMDPTASMKMNTIIRVGVRE